jgi:hypothetical protein
MSEQQLDQPAPLLFYQGQPTSPAHAAEMRAVLMADKEFSKAVLAGDGAKSKQLANLWMIERGYQPAEPLPSTPSAADVRAVEEQANDRVARASKQHRPKACVRPVSQRRQSTKFLAAGRCLPRKKPFGGAS